MEPNLMSLGKVTKEISFTLQQQNYKNIANTSGRTHRPSTGAASTQNKLERGKSRRGTKNELDFYTNSASNKPATPGRNVLGRPPSSVILTTRAPTAMSRLNVINSGNFGSLNNALSTSGQVNISVLERPITQHGVAGVRPGTTKTLPMMRQIQDKRYYIGILQLKIRELTQEITVIMKDIEDQNKERAKFIHYDRRAKDLASELTVLQGELADYNIVIDKGTSDVGIESIEHEAEVLALKNERTLMEIEKMFDERTTLEQDLNKMQKQLQNKEERTELLIESMDGITRKKYNDLLIEKAELQEKANKTQLDLDELSKEQIYLEEELALSPLKQEAVKLRLKIIEVEQKREKLKEEEKNRLSPKAEKEKLLQKIKQDNVDIAAGEAQLAEKRKRMEESEQELEQLETDIEETQSEKQIKYNELRKREEVMEQFMFSFEQNKEDETIKLEKLQEAIVKHLEIISKLCDSNIDFAVNDEIAILNNIPPYNDTGYTNSDQNFEGLTKEHLKLQRLRSKMQMFEQQLKMESSRLNEGIAKGKNKIMKLEDLNNLKNKSEADQKKLTVEYEQLQKQQLLVQQEVEVIRDEYDKIKQQLTSNEMYNQIDVLEDTFEKLREDRTKMEELIKVEYEHINSGPLKNRAFNLLNDYGAILKENLKSVY